MCIMNSITVIRNVFSNDKYQLERVKKYGINAVILSVKFVHCV